MDLNRDMVPLRIYPKAETPVKEGFSRLSLTRKDMLNRLRMTALGCRTAAHSDLSEACAVLSSSTQVAENAHVETLMRCLSQALGKEPKLFRPSVEEISFDEAWLLRAVDAASAKDWDSFEFLIRSRVPRGARRHVGSLLSAVSEQFSLT